MKIFYFKKTFLWLTALMLSILLSIIITYFVVQTTPTQLNEEIDYIENNNQDYCDDSVCEIRHELLTQKYQQKKLIALTFDDGPSKYTEELVDGLKKRNVPATFFVLGQNVEKRIAALQFAYDAGNEIGIHSYMHKLFTKLKEEEIIEQIDQTRTIIETTTGTAPTLIRVPYGAINTKVTSILDKSLLTSVLWSVDSKDWQLKNTNKVYQNVMKHVKGNDIILMHDSYKTSVEAAFKIVDQLLSQCYTFVTVSEFIQIQHENSKTGI